MLQLRKQKAAVSCLRWNQIAELFRCNTFFLSNLAYLTVPLIPADLQWWCLTGTTSSLHLSKPWTDLVIKQQNHPKMIIQPEVPPIEGECETKEQKQTPLGKKKNTMNWIFMAWTRRMENKGPFQIWHLLTSVVPLLIFLHNFGWSHLSMCCA